jgi:myosin heavy subunit
MNSPVVNYPDDISELTDISPPQDHSEILTIFKKTMQLSSVEALKLKCKNNNITSYSKMKQSELVECLCIHFEKIIDAIKLLTLVELRNICKYNSIKGFSTQKKSELIESILKYNASCIKSEFIYKDTYTKSDKEEKDSKLTKEELLIQLEKIQKQEEAAKLQEEEKAKKLQEEEEKVKKLQEEVKKLQEEEAKKLQEEDAKKLQEEEEKAKKLQKSKDKKIKEVPLPIEPIQEEDKNIKYKKQSIPKSIKKIVWDMYIGHDIIKHRCLCCKRVIIDNTNFHCGHVISEKDGGTLETGNLRPICASCNLSMGSENMIDYVKKYGLFIG